MDKKDSIIKNDDNNPNIKDKLKRYLSIIVF